MLEKVKQFYSDLNLNENKVKKLEKVVDFCLSLKQKELIEALDPKNPAYKMAMRLFDYINNNIKEIEHDKGIQTIILLKANDQKEQATRLCNSLTNGWDEKLSQALRSILFDCETKLLINGVSISSSQVRVLFAALRKNKTLTTLYLNKNNISSKGMKFIAEALKNNRTLTNLYLYANEKGNGVISAISNAINKERTAPFKCDVLGDAEQEKVNNSIAENIKRHKGQIRFVEKLLEETCEIREVYHVKKI